MADASHVFGSDLSVGPTGDLALSSGTAYGQERVLRRLLTNPGDEIWLLDYGAGLPGMVGQPTNARRIQAIARSQMLQEQAVARTPAPTVDVTVQNTGVVTASVRYADANTGEPATLTFPVV